MCGSGRREGVPEDCSAAASGIRASNEERLDLVVHGVHRVAKEAIRELQRPPGSEEVYRISDADLAEAVAKAATMIAVLM